MENTIINDENFSLYCYIELPIIVNGFIYVWNEINTNNFLENYLNKRLGMHAPIHSRFEMNYKVKFDINDRKIPMIYVEFYNFDDLNYCFNILKHPMKTEEWGYMICRLLEYTSVR